MAVSQSFLSFPFFCLLLVVSILVLKTANSPDVPIPSAKKRSVRWTHFVAPNNGTAPASKNLLTSF
jgi:hypothetical protein